MNSYKRRERKQIITIIVTFAVVLALIVVYNVVRNINSDNSDDMPDDKGVEGTFQIIDEDYKNVSALSYVHDWEELKFKVVDGKWTLEDDPDFPLDQTTVSYMAAAISDYGGFRRIDYDPEKYSDYGFDEPTYKISVTYYDKAKDSFRTRSYVIGLKNPVTGYYYFYEDGDKYLYSINDTLFQYFDYTKEELFISDKITGPNLKDIVDITAEYNGQTYVIEPRDETDEVDTTDDSDTSKDEKDPVESLMDILTRDIKLSYKTCVDYKKSEDDNAKYGFDDPTLKLTIHYKEYEKVDAESGVSEATIVKDKSCTLIFGSVVTATEESNTESEDSSSENDGTESAESTESTESTDTTENTESKIYLKFEGSNIKYQIDYSICEKILAYFTEANE